MATFNVNVIAGYDHTYQTYQMHTSVPKFSSRCNLWLLGEITAIKTASSDDGSIGIQTTYTVEYGDGKEEELEHEEIKERIRGRQFIPGSAVHSDNTDLTHENLVIKTIFLPGTQRLH